MTRSPKPPYRIPSMAAIAALPPNGFTVASTFSGCGGSSLGYRLAGYRVVWANEFIAAARDSYAANAPTTPLDPRDIRLITAADVVAATGLPVGALDILDGSPPCASFSAAGKLEAHWGQAKTYSDTVQRTDDLFFEYARLVRELQPRVFVAENVTGLVRGVAKGMFKRVLATFTAAGYRVEARVLDAQWLGVPQARQRVLFQGVRADLGRAPAWPTPLPYRYSVRDALPTIGVVAVGTHRATRSLDVPAPTVLSHGRGHTHSEITLVVEPETDISRYAIGREWDTMAPGETSAKYFSLIRPALDKPCPTVTCGGNSNAGAAGVVHPTERRRFAIAELKRLCGFPDDFVLVGTYAQQWERLGRAVPPPMMAALASAIRDGVLAPLAQQATA